VVTARVQRQVAGLFVAEERGSYELKGVPEPVTLFQIVRASGGGRRAGQRRLTPLVGREEELAMVMRRWERARQGDGQLVLIVGEPWLGKSRAAPPALPPPNRSRPNSAIGCSGVFCRSCEQLHSTQVCGVSRRRA
jgi:hypothetical protein